MVVMLHFFAGVQVQEGAREAGPGIHLQQQIGNLHAREPRTQLPLQRLHLVGHGFGDLPNSELAAL
ncbi:hypothetical protein [Deinococcus arcticus]|uniref:Uncharacterized protein n=1 Tax=Deinococcus arcticus TaxID=2136176 RepID=A0A2T3W4C5_9DEIO|nr:hypothetical protein [Deinococcus arcticus]PTA66745.1 hypothetical protein C8263_16055 [Deinococcus arcticus]